MTLRLRGFGPVVSATVSRTRGCGFTAPASTVKSQQQQREGHVLSKIAYSPFKMKGGSDLLSLHVNFGILHLSLLHNPDQLSFLRKLLKTHLYYPGFLADILAFCDILFVYVVVVNCIVFESCCINNLD